MNNLFIVGRFTIYVSGDADNSAHTLAIQFAVAGKNNGTTIFTGSTSSAGRYDQSFTFAVPAPGALYAFAALAGVAGRGRKNHRR